jgi:hypothetical protein
MGGLPMHRPRTGPRGRNRGRVSLKDGISHGPVLFHEIQTTRDKDESKSRVFTMVGRALPLW